MTVADGQWAETVAVAHVKAIGRFVDTVRAQHSGTPSTGPLGLFLLHRLIRPDFVSACSPIFRRTFCIPLAHSRVRSEQLRRERSVFGPVLLTSK